MKMKITNSSVLQSKLLLKKIKREIDKADLSQEQKNGVYCWLLVEARKELNEMLELFQQDMVIDSVSPNLLFDDKFDKEFVFNEGKDSTDNYENDPNYQLICDYLKDYDPSAMN